MPDKVVVSAIDCVVALGVSAEERAVKQRLSVDVEISTDTRAAARSDSLEDAIDYAPIVSLVVDLAARQAYHLIETLAEAIAREVLTNFGGAVARVVIRKTPPPLAARVAFVAVEIERTAARDGVQDV
jgi:dihydroneopterin aldolase